MAKPPIRSIPRRKAQQLPPGDKMGLGLWWVFGLIVLAVVSTFALPTVVILLIGMLPAWVAFIVDPNPAKAAGKCVLSLNLVGIAPYLTNPVTWFIMYGSAAVGWLIYLGMPHVIGGFMEMRDESRKAQMADLRKEIVEEWGEEIGGAMQRRQD